MTKRNPYDAQAVDRIIRLKVMHRLRLGERDDFRQEAHLKVLHNLSKYDSDRGTFEAFAGQVVWTAFLSFLRAGRCPKRAMQVSNIRALADGEEFDLFDLHPVLPSVEAECDLAKLRTEIVRRARRPEVAERILGETDETYEELAERAGVSRQAIHHGVKRVQAWLITQHYA